jgi:LPXTG-motif cell wall-anchored protein
MARKLMILATAAALLFAGAASALAQEAPYDVEVAPVIVDRPAPAQVVPPAAPPAAVEAPAPAQVPGLAQTGRSLTVGMALVVLLVLSGGALLLVARRRRRLA